MFKRSEEHDRFFKDLDKEKKFFSLEFDLWYMCFLVGVVKGLREPLNKGIDMLGHFPAKYSSQEGVLIAMLLRAELSAKGVSLENRAAVQSVVDYLIDPMSRPPLTPSGFKAFNEYAAGGYEIIRERLSGEEPKDVSAFILNFGELFIEVLNKSDLW